jgi:hypothetical protein
MDSTPINFPRIAEYGNPIVGAHLSKQQILKEKTSVRRTTYLLIFRPTGYVCAGSCARYQPYDVWQVCELINGVSYGRSFSTLAEAEAHFESRQ